MIKLERYVHSRRPYAVDLDSFRARSHSGRFSAGDQAGEPFEWWRCNIEALWFRGKAGAPVACAGVLSWLLDAQPTSVEAAVKAHDDGRYGGTCHAKWDGSALWTPGAIPLAAMEVLIARLQPMLSAFPDVPAGHSGWWTFVA